MYELWNEPDQSYSFTGTMAQMITLNQHMYSLIRSIDPAAMIASPSIVLNPYMQDYWTATNPSPPKGIDVIAIHGYPNAPVDDAPESILAFKTVTLKTTLIQEGLAAKQIWDTEASWGKPASYNSDPDFRAGYLARAYLLHWSAGVQRRSWYAWDDPIWGTLWSPVTGIAKAGVAYGQVYNWMVGATMPQPCSYTGTNVYEAVYTCPLTRPSGYQALAVWDTTQTCSDGVCTTTNYTPNIMFTQFRDLNGKITPIQRGEVIQIGSKPILLEN